jgi:hypothetical protein
LLLLCAHTDSLKLGHFDERYTERSRDNFNVLDECIHRIAVRVELHDLLESRLKAREVQLLFDFIWQTLKPFHHNENGQSSERE